MSYTRVNFTQAEIDILFELCQGALDFSRTKPIRSDYDGWHAKFLSLQPTFEYIEDQPNQFLARIPAK